MYIYIYIYIYIHHIYIYIYIHIIRWYLFSTLGMMFTTFPALAVLLRLPRFQEFIEFYVCEIIVVGLMVLLSARESSHMRVEFLALGLDAMVTAVHVALPIRWYVIVWVDALIVIGYSVQVVRNFGETADYGELYLILCFAGLVVAANLGLRSNELADRRVFAMVVDERSLRARAEFNLERVFHQSSDAPVIDAASKASTGRHQGSAAPSARTNNTELLFQRMGEDAGFASAMLRTLGEQERWLVEQDKLEIFSTQVLGRGGFGLVVKGRYYRAPVAVKLFVQKGNVSHEYEAVMNELRVLRRLKHPNIVVFYGASLFTSTMDERLDIRLIFEHAKGKTLNKFCRWMHGGRNLPLNGRQIASCRCIMKDVARAVIYLHDTSPPIVHSDLKPSNIMVLAPWPAPTAKLLDFGISRVVSRRSLILGGTSGFKAHEMLTGDPLQASPAVDMFAFGRILQHLASGKIKKADLASATLPEEWKDPVEACTRADPSKRPTATQLYRTMFEEGAPAASSRSLGSLASLAAVGSGEDDGFPSDSIWFQTADPLKRELPPDIVEGLRL